MSFEGFGASVTGGAGGTTIHVTNLNDSGAGSLRAALLSEGARIIVFDVSGTINLTSDIVIENGAQIYDDFTLDGSTAPNQGIQIAGHTILVRCDNTITQYLRFRSDDQGGFSIDSFSLQDATNAVIDHCTIQWGDDGDLDIVGGCNNVTVSWCILGPGFGAGTMLLNSIGNITVHHNLFYQGSGNRQPEAGGSAGGPLSCDWVNNLHYRNRPGTEQPLEYGYLSLWLPDNGTELVNFDRNIFIAGTNENVTLDGRPVILYGDRTYSSGSSMWFNGNVVPAYSDPTTQDHVYLQNNGTAFAIAGSRFAYPAVTTTTAAQAYIDVMAGAGCRLPCLDARDTELLAAVTGRTGSYNAANSTALGGYPDLTQPCSGQSTIRLAYRLH
jgi:hypothetical protein